MNAAPSAVEFVRHPAGRGVVWLKESWVMLSAARVQWLLLLLTYYLIWIVVTQVPDYLVSRLIGKNLHLGPTVMMVLRPVFTVGFLAAAWNQERGGAPEIAYLFRGFRANLWALIPIGVFVIVGTTLAIFMTALVDGGKLLQAVAGEQPLEDALDDTSVQLAMVFASLCAAPVLLAGWFAPALVVFNNCGPARALRTSLRAALANWRPTLVYALLLLFFGAIIPALALTMIAAMLPPAAAWIIVALTVVPYIALFTATQAISDYVSYRDIFHADEGPAPPPEPETDAA